MNVFAGLMGLSAAIWIITPTFAQPIQGMSFSHQDWEVYCSNVGTCRAAGYQSDEMQGMPASILLTRNAGAKQTVQTKFALADFEHALDQNKLKGIHFYINHQDLGAVAVTDSDTPLMGLLNSKQVSALLQQTKQNVNIVFKNSHYTWQISDAGMSAVLLKMDDFQKRVGTVGALVNKGQRNEATVLSAQPKRQVKKVNTATQPYLTLKPKTRSYTALHQVLMAARPKTEMQENFCKGIYNDEGAQPQAINLYTLGKHTILATTLCWRGAYNEGYGAWVLDQSLTGKATFITESASSFGHGQISSAQKGRGIGDCWARAEWIWNGQAFVQTVNRWSGMCKGLAAGGVWDVDLIETVVQP